MAHKIFLKYYIKLEGLKSQKLAKPHFLEDSHFSEKAQKFLQKKGFFGFWKNFNPLISLFLS